MRRALLGSCLALLVLSSAHTRVAAQSDHGASIVRVLGPFAASALAPSSGQVGALVALPAGATAESLGLDPVAPGIGRLRASAPAVLAFANAHPDLHVEVTPPSRLMLDQARLATGLGLEGTPPKGATGKGAMVGVADTGLDVTLDDFKDPVTKKSRVAWYLDLAEKPVGLHPELEQQFGIKDGSGQVIAGAVYTGADIDARIAAGQTVPIDDVGHGTHVTSIAAGNGAGSVYKGFAPEATLVIARVTRQASTSIENDDILRGTQFIFDRADASAMPVVANLSLGSDFGPHDGTTLWEASLASFVGTAHPGHALVVAGGNSGSVVEMPIHQSVHVTRGPTVRVPITSQGARSGTVEVWVTEHEGATLSVGLDGPDGSWIDPVADGDEVGKNTDSYNAGVIHGTTAAGTSVPSGSRGATIVWSGKFPAGTYAVTLSGEGTAELYLQATGDADVQGSTPTLFSVGVREGTIDLPSTHPDLIGVGATINRTRWTSIAKQSVSIGVPILDSTGRVLDSNAMQPGAPNTGDVAWFSGAGPTAVGVPKPDILAPGGIVVAALSQQALPGVQTSIFTTPSCPPNKQGQKDERCLQVDAHHGVSLGTSMAAPMVAGVVALLFERDPTLTSDVVRALLQAGAHPVRGAAPFYDQAGPGEIDIPGTLSAQDDLDNPAIALPDASNSWMTLSADFAAADGSIPLTVLLELRSSSGHRAALFDASRLQPVAEIGGRPVPTAPVIVRAPAPGLFTFRVVVPPGKGGESLTVGATFDGQAVVQPVTVPISTDAWSSSYSSRTKGACDVSGPLEAGSRGWAFASLVLSVLVWRRRTRAT